MTCRHSKDDPECSSYPRRRAAELKARTPDPDKFDILDAQIISDVLVMKIKYETCANCSYNGTKILLYRGVALIDVIKWKRIDPHFDEPTKKLPFNHAPSPIARFPASEDGWKAAISYAYFLTNTNKNEYDGR